MKRLFDIVVSLTGLVALSPFFLVIALWIILEDGIPVFYLQERIGRGGEPFRLFKFRTMRKNADKQGLLTVGSRDSRITRSGYYLRKYKLDELPQLFNVLNGTMSLVGPRPEVRKYVELYDEEQRKILNVRPGITDYASLEYFSENDLLAASEHPERTYIEQVMPAKLQLNRKYIDEAGLMTDIRIIWKTLMKVFSAR